MASGERQGVPWSFRTTATAGPPSAGRAPEPRAGHRCHHGEARKRRRHSPPPGGSGRAHGDHQCRRDEPANDSRKSDRPSKWRLIDRHRRLLGPADATGCRYRVNTLRRQGGRQTPPDRHQATSGRTRATPGRDGEHHEGSADEREQCPGAREPPPPIDQVLSWSQMELPTTEQLGAPRDALAQADRVRCDGCAGQRRTHRIELSTQARDVAHIRALKRLLLQANADGAAEEDEAKKQREQWTPQGAPPDECRPDVGVCCGRSNTRRLIAGARPDVRSCRGRSNICGTAATPARAVTIRRDRRPATLAGQRSPAIPGVAVTVSRRAPWQGGEGCPRAPRESTDCAAAGRIRCPRPPR